MSLGIHYTSVSVMFGAGLLVLWLLLAGYSIRGLSARAILTLSGHLRARPDPWLESRLRAAFADFDRELAAILHDRACPARPGSATRPGRQGSQAAQSSPGSPPSAADKP